MSKDLVDRLNVYLYKENQEIIDFLKESDNKNNAIKFALKYLIHHEGTELSIPKDTSDEFLDIYFSSMNHKKE